jgi:cell division protein DivIC
MRFINKIPSWLKSKYTLTTIVFVVWMLFFDEQDFITTHFKQRAELNRLKESRDHYKDEIAKTLEELDQLKSDPALLEKYAREKYRMKKENEDLFIIPDPAP